MGHTDNSYAFARFVCSVVAIILIGYSAVTALCTVFSLRWFVGATENNVSLGIMSENCVTNTTVNMRVFMQEKLRFCSYDTFSFSDITTPDEKAVVALLFLSFILGSVCIFFLLLNVFTCVSCAHFWNAVTSALAFLQFIFILAVCTDMAAVNGWGQPQGTKLGPAYIANIVGIFTSLFGCLLCAAIYRYLRLHDAEKWKRSMPLATMAPIATDISPAVSRPKKFMDDFPATPVAAAIRPDKNGANAV
eukprot:comp20360_c0_seq1/m.25715 comp20360_c0_seq1/g.25715  ORF comp20360_c0_seq1/g.25715 comp20360_c0_seq1/m.25715 type:complete len:248 (-) comp20360_c0_seq1:488-1231(-)